jgi:hypothetical protein
MSSSIPFFLISQKTKHRVIRAAKAATAMAVAVAGLTALDSLHPTFRDARLRFQGMQRSLPFPLFISHSHNALFFAVAGLQR